MKNQRFIFSEKLRDLWPGNPRKKSENTYLARKIIQKLQFDSKKHKVWQHKFVLAKFQQMGCCPF